MTTKEERKEQQLELEARANAAIYALGKYFAELEIHNGAVLDIEANGGYHEEFVVDRLESLDDIKTEILRVMREEIAYQKEQHPEFFSQDY